MPASFFMYNETLTGLTTNFTGDAVLTALLFLGCLFILLSIAGLDLTTKVTILIVFLIGIIYSIVSSSVVISVVTALVLILGLIVYSYIKRVLWG